MGLLSLSPIEQMLSEGRDLPQKQTLREGWGMEEIPLEEWRSEVGKEEEKAGNPGALRWGLEGILPQKRWDGIPLSQKDLRKEQGSWVVGAPTPASL